MTDPLSSLYATVLSRRDTKLDGSYTCYLFGQGLDKMLKKCGEECAEVIIAAKDTDKEALVGEMCDLLYHLTVVMAEKGISPDDIYEELDRRAEKERNLKPVKTVDKNT